MLEIDGAQGEGGGQVLRTSLALSILAQRPFRLTRIRAGRDRPGLLRQHLTAVRAAAAVSGAEVEGAELGSREITFRPGPQIVPGDHAFAIGSAGSVNLVLQTVVWPLVAASGPSRLTLEGGTHNDASPPTPFLQHTFAPLVGRMGPTLTLTLERWGFYPAGGGALAVDVVPAPMKPLTLLERGAVRSITVDAAVSGLSSGIAAREIRTAAEALGIEPDLRRITVVDGRGPGNAMWVTVECEAITHVFTGFGAKGVPAERVAEACAAEARAWLAADVPVDGHLADQLLIPLALAGGAFRTTAPTRHTTTNIEVIRRFLDAPIAVQPDGDAFRVDVSRPRTRT